MRACLSCGGGLIREVVPRFHDDLMGIPVILVNSVVSERCENCGATNTAIPETKELIAAVAVGRVMLPFKLNGTEIRFLRKAMEMTARELAARLEVREETISRWENGREPIGPSSEKLLRLAVGEALHEKAPAVDYEQRAVLDMRIQSARLPEQTRPMCFERVVFKSREHGKNQRWDTQPNAA